MFQSFIGNNVAEISNGYENQGYSRYLIMFYIKMWTRAKRGASTKSSPHTVDCEG